MSLTFAQDTEPDQAARGQTCTGNYLRLPSALISGFQRKCAIPIVFSLSYTSIKVFLNNTKPRHKLLMTQSPHASAEFPRKKKNPQVRLRLPKHTTETKSSASQLRRTRLPRTTIGRKRGVLVQPPVSDWTKIPAIRNKHGKR